MIMIMQSLRLVALDSSDCDQYRLNFLPWQSHVDHSRLNADPHLMLVFTTRIYLLCPGLQPQLRVGGAFHGRRHADIPLMNEIN